jgi:hypothetical protein
MQEVLRFCYAAEDYSVRDSTICGHDWMLLDGTASKSRGYALHQPWTSSLPLEPSQTYSSVPLRVAIGGITCVSLASAVGCRVVVSG